MFLGHLGAALAAKRIAPETSLGTTFLAAQLADLAWPTLVLLGVETVKIAPGITAVTPLDFERYPYTHSLVAAVLWSSGFALLYSLVRRDRRKNAWILGALVFSHWILDWISHRPDLPLTLTGEARVGLGLWNSLAATLVVELAIFGGGVWLYARSTAPKDRVGRWSFVALIAFLLAIYAGNLFGPPPPSAAAIAWTGQAIWLLVAWGYWIDRHRTTAA
ncbi:MAG TPA: hypothetical protein VF139_04695 [Candidatus Polarisedimenticolaceae bacterium]